MTATRPAQRKGLDHRNMPLDYQVAPINLLAGKEDGDDASIH